MRSRNGINPFDRTGRRRLLVDSNLLLLHLCGRFRGDLIPELKPLRSLALDNSDFNRLQLLINQFGPQPLVTTPHILAEVSNLAGKFPEQTAIVFRLSWQHLIPDLLEVHVPIRDWLKCEAFPRLGVTDTALLELAAKDCVVLTVDRPLAGMLIKRKLPVIEYYQYRQNS